MDIDSRTRFSLNLDFSTTEIILILNVVKFFGYDQTSKS